MAGRRGVIGRYFEHLPVSELTPVVTLDEGDTPLLRSERLSMETGAEVWLKYEGLNPTGSFKDRGMTLAISKALEAESQAVVCASTGNTSASAAAYAARAGVRCGVLIPSGKVALGKLAQALVHGARVVEIEGNFDRALALTQELAANHPVTLVNSVNPFRIQGQKTAAFEIVEALGRAPNMHLMPVGNAGNITSYWLGYREATQLGWADSTPRMFGFQAEGAAPIVRGHPVDEPETVATAIRIGNPASWDGAVAAARDSAGAIEAVTDDDIIAAYHSLAREGIFVELASAASIAGLRKLHQEGAVEPGSMVVCVLTGHGLKDPDTAMRAETPLARVDAEVTAILRAMDLG
ncbi:MAG: threonine synthase [Actinobacteria bacterium]|nr:threonine synthase [Actinomycetota bacterium]